MITLRFPVSLLTRVSLAATLFCAACSHGTSVGVSPTSKQKMFVTIADSSQIQVFRNAAEGAQPMETIKEKAPDRPVDCSANYAGEVYVANENGNVRVYGAGHDEVYKLIKNYEGPHTRLDHPVGIAVNPAGSFYVADAGKGHGRVEWFSGGANEDIFPDKVLEGTDTGISEPGGVAIDGSGRTFVTDRKSNRVLIFDPNAHDDDAPMVALDGLHQPGRIAVDDLVNIYVVNGDNSVVVLSSTGPESWGPPVTITDKLRSPGAIATNQSSQIAVGANGGIWFFATDSQRESDPLFHWDAGSPQTNPSGVCFH